MATTAIASATSVKTFIDFDTLVCPKHNGERYMIANSPKKNRFLIFVGQEFFFGHNRENPVNEISINNLDINLGYFSWAAISYRLGKDFRSGRYRCNLGLACT